jgi:hypothetical protein
MVFDEEERNIVEYEWKIAGSQDLEQDNRI